MVSDEARRADCRSDPAFRREHVLISATHTHSASSALGKDRFKHDQHARRLSAFRRPADRRRRRSAPSTTLRPAQIGFGTAEAPEHVFNRRWYMKPGTMPPNPFGGDDLVKMNPPRRQPEPVEPAGPTDPTISFIAVREPGGRPISRLRGLLAALRRRRRQRAHLGRLLRHVLRATWPGCSRPSGRSRRSSASWPTAPAATSTTSTSASRGRGKQPYEQMRYVAEDVAAKVHAALGKVKYQRPRHARRPLPRADDRLAASDAGAARLGEEDDRRRPHEPRQTDLPFIYAERTLRMAEYPETTQVPLQVLRIGDVCIGTMPVRGVLRDRPGVQANAARSSRPSWSS